jgi:hypothetical protein
MSSGDQCAGRGVDSARKNSDDVDTTEEVASRHRQQAEQWNKYREENWVNDASGYLAICGKYSPEEEKNLLLQVPQD